MLHASGGVDLFLKTARSVPPAYSKCNGVCRVVTLRAAYCEPPNIYVRSLVICCTQAQGNSVVRPGIMHKNCTSVYLIEAERGSLQCQKNAVHVYIQLNTLVCYCKTTIANQWRLCQWSLSSNTGNTDHRFTHECILVRRDGTRIMSCFTAPPIVERRTTCGSMRMIPEAAPRATYPCVVVTLHSCIDRTSDSMKCTYCSSQHRPKNVTCTLHSCATFRNLPKNNSIYSSPRCSND